MSNEATAVQLAARTSGPVWSRTAVDRASYDEGRSGFNLALDHQPALVLAAATPADVVEGIRFAADNGLPVDVQATGHGAHRRRATMVAQRRPAVGDGKILAMATLIGGTALGVCVCWCWFCSCRGGSPSD